MGETENGPVIDAVTQEVIRHKLDAIADEMETTLLQSAYSSIVKEAQDASAALFDPTGKTIAQSVAIPAHLGMLIPAVETIVETFEGEMRPGDVYMMNDPYDGGTHLPDITVVKPVFSDGDVVALGATMAHHQEMGGKTPGSIPTDATEIYQEGLRFPPLKLHDEGEPNETLLAVLEKNVRIPETVVGDLNAQISSVSKAERRIQELTERYGNDGFRTATGQILDHAEELTRTHLRDIPDGEYSFVDFIDDDGVNVHEPIRIEATVEIDGSNMHVDFTGTADQVDGPVNCVPAATLSAVYYVVRAITDSDIPNNAGCFEPVTAHLPEGSLVNPLPPAPVNARTVTFKRIADVLLGAIAKAVPERVSAPGSGQLAAFTFAGPGDGDPWIYGETGAGGSGGRPTKDGIDCIETDVTNCMNTTAEATELEFPIRVWRYDLWEDSGGPGRHRGGLGYVKHYEMLDEDVTFTHRRDRHDFQPWGLGGGEPAPRCRTEVHRASGSVDTLPSKTIESLERGDLVVSYTTGGGGYGDPKERDPEAIAQDVRDGTVSPEQAEMVYGAVLDDDGAVDVEATKRAREGPERRGTEDGLTVDRGELPDAVNVRE